MTTYGLTNQENVVWLHTGERVFYSPKHSSLVSGHIQPPIGRHRSCFLGSTMAETWRQLPPSTAKIENEWSYTSTVPYASKECKKTAWLDFM